MNFVVSVLQITIDQQKPNFETSSFSTTIIKTGPERDRLVELPVKSISFYYLNIETIYEFGIKETHIFIYRRDRSLTQD